MLIPLFFVSYLYIYFKKMMFPRYLSLCTGNRVIWSSKLPIIFVHFRYISLSKVQCNSDFYRCLPLENYSYALVDSSWYFHFCYLNSPSLKIAEIYLELTSFLCLQFHIWSFLHCSKDREPLLFLHWLRFIIDTRYSIMIHL